MEDFYEDVFFLFFFVQVSQEKKSILKYQNETFMQKPVPLFFFFSFFFYPWMEACEQLMKGRENGKGQ